MNLDQALLETTFRLPTTPNSVPTSKGWTPRVAQLGLFLDKHFDKLSPFDDVKAYVADLSFEEAKAFVENILPKMLEDVSRFL